MSFLQILNPYANLLSAFITFLLLGLTAVYVVLTWRNLKVFERTSLHEHRLRHLEDIKRLVAVPIREWFEQVLRALEGESRVLTVTSVSVPMSHVLVGDSYDYIRRLDSALPDSQGLKGDLIRDAAERHFPRLVAVQEFSNNLNQFISELVVFARESADSIAAKTKLKRSQQYMPGEECADSDSFVASCVRALVCGEKPSFDANNPRLLGKFTISDRFAGGGTLACGPRDSLLPWSEESVVFVIEQWERSGLGARAQRLRDAARDLRQSVAALELTYALQGDCQYVGKSK